MDEAFAAGPPRRRRRVGPIALVVLVTLVVANAVVWAVAVFLLRPADPPSAWVSTAEEPRIVPVEPSPVLPDAVQGEPLPVFATAAGVHVRLPSGDAVAVAFHEASYRDALALRPTGVCGRCKNATKFTPPPPRDPALRYLVTHSRGRATPATSAADVVLPKGTAVLAPVDGVVVRVRRYRLYRSYPDMRVEIAPDADPARRVALLHLGAVQVRPGERVTASASLIGVPRKLPFESQVDRYVRGRYPHVHLEVKDAPATRPATS
jgi:hypothetical protein